MRWLELNTAGLVVNIVVWDGVSEYAPQGVAQLLRCDDHPGVSFGWQKVEGGWIEPLQPESE